MAVYTIPAHPVKYNYTLYRSKTEARWAAWFDFMGYEFEYEPEPFKTWSPDFLLQAWGGIYIEVKPQMYWDIELINKLQPFAETLRVGLIHEDLYTGESAIYPGKYFNKNYKKDGLILKDITVPYDPRLNQDTVEMLWTEAKNKVMYLKP